MNGGDMLAVNNKDALFGFLGYIEKVDNVMIEFSPLHQENITGFLEISSLF